MKPDFKIGQREVEALDPTRERLLVDSAVPGFMLRVRGGRKVYVLKYGSGRRFKKGEKGTSAKWVTIGEHGKPWRPDPVTGLRRMLTATLARQEAERLRGLIQDGKDPAADRDNSRQMKTLRQFSKRYLDEHAVPHKGERTVVEDRRNLDKLILPAFGDVPLDRLDRGTITRWHLGLKRTPRRANIALNLLAAIYEQAKRWGVLKHDHENPARGIKRFPEGKRERLLLGAELALIYQEFRRAEAAKELDPTIAAGLLLCMFTGARPLEICSMLWEKIDRANGLVMVVLRKGQGGKSVERPVFLSSHALDVIGRLVRIEGNPYVLPGRWAKSHISRDTLTHAWAKIAKDAGVRNCRLYDLRHLFASRAVAAGYSLYETGAVLGHSQQSTTQRYAHLKAAPQLALTESIAGTIKGEAETPPKE